MMFDKKLAAHDIIYSFKFTVVLPDLEEVHYEYEGNSYETYLSKMIDARQQVENIYQKLERREVTEF